ncbi:N-acetylmuramoyl-L-alanine amidase [Treponema bryantii]|uniref:N-acetylmuramoyl-L-alanine amidase n=1 Tax=Treponema bryantii TaxID=163 RepID=UPI002B2982ED|nr:hypothetical protein TRBR_13070 [Treponema bryantii]
MLTTDSLGRVSNRYNYDAYGTNYTGSFSGKNKIGYNSKHYDTGTGWYNYGYRDYDSKLGRFTTQDPIRDGMNWYAYCGGDPINYVDLWGLFSESDKSTRYTDNIIQYRIPDGNGSRIEKNRAKTTGIVIHYTAGVQIGKDGKEYAQTPKETIDYWIGAESINAHFVIGENGDIYQALPKQEIGQHAGNGGPYTIQPGIVEKLGGHPNARTVGIEMENIDSKGTITEQTKNATIQLTAELCVEYGLDPQKDVYRHYDITNKPCPKNYVDNPDSWNDFKNQVEKEINKIKNKI